jgi:DNA-binding HxlR family transcriptional regulator
MKKDIAEAQCPIKKTLDVIGGKWKLRIIAQIGTSICRYGELKKLIPDISEKMLIQELKSLVENEILNKKSYHEVPPRVEYSLSKKGKKVLPLIDDMVSLGLMLLKEK